MESFYDKLVAQDVLEWVGPLLDKAGWTFRYEDGKIVQQFQPVSSTNPWYHVKSDWRLHCAMWHQIIFDLAGQMLPDGKKFVPSKCQQCFKVVVRPKTVKQLFALADLQEKLDRPCKCGIEVRKTTHSNYGGYFYNVTLREGLECFDIVRKAVDENKYLGPDVEVLLKRACTEFEHACGDSDKWTISEYQLHVEALIERFVVLERKELKQPEIMVNHVKRRWIEFAFERGDETYKEFTGGKPLYPKYKTYHHMIDKYRSGESLRIEGIYDAPENNKGGTVRDEKGRYKKVENTASRKPKRAEKAVTNKG